MKATALEILSEPLSLLILVSSIVLAVGAPALHYHQFGDATRMARDAGFSAIFTCGNIFAVFCTIRSFRREIESGTMAMALAHPISRTSYFIAKTAGAFLAYLVFSLILALVTLIVVKGAQIGGIMAESYGGVARLWGPSLAIGCGVLIIPLVLAALLNRFFRIRFVRFAFMSSLALAAVGVCYRFDHNLALRFLPAFLALLPLAAVFLSAVAAFSVRFASNIASTLAIVTIALSSPFAGNYFLSDSLSRGGFVSWGYVGLAALAAVPMVAAFVALGALYVNSKEVS